MQLIIIKTRTEISLTVITQLMTNFMILIFMILFILMLSKLQEQTIDRILTMINGSSLKDQFESIH